MRKPLSRRSANIADYAGHPHFWKRALSRRQFLGAAGGVSTLGLMVASGIGFPKLTHADTLPTVLPRPIPGGFLVSDFGITIPNATELFHAFAPLAALGNDPITITDFHGFIAAAEITGYGTVTTPAGPARRFFDNDMRFMQGQYIGVDGREHNGTFGFF